MFKRRMSILCVLITAIILSLSLVSNASSTGIISPKHKISNINEFKAGNENVTASKVRPELASLSESVSAAVVDGFEPNDTVTGPAIVVGDKLFASIGNGQDRDFYIRKFSGTKVAISLKNIPAGCDYDLYLCDQFGNIMAYSESDGNKDEVIAYNLPQVGSYLVAVLPYIGYSPDSYYTLDFVDNRIKTDGHAFASASTPALWVFKAGQTSASKSLDLRSDSSIPEDAIVTSVSIGGNLNYSKSYYKEVSTLNSPWYRTETNGYYINTFAPGTKLKTVWYARFCPLSIDGAGASWIPSINFYYSYDPYINYLKN
ncbi:MAG TPA: hypothetical protein VHP38_14750 [Ruminiclostridium sp.]|nr:hypothetical protein [Ruminiclostridium sp.]